MSTITSDPLASSSSVKPRRRIWIWTKRFGVFVLVWMAYRAVVLFAPSNRLKVGPTTTILDGPLLPNGRVDYATYLNEKAAEGVTPDNNAFLRLLETHSPATVPSEHRERLCKWLKIPELPESNEPYVDTDEYGAVVDQQVWEEHEARERLMQGSDEIPPAPPQAEPLVENDPPARVDNGLWEGPSDPSSSAPLRFGYQVTKAMIAPWTRDQYPEVAKWVERNQSTIDAWERASRCERYFAPILVAPGDPIVFSDKEFTFGVTGARTVVVCRANCLLGEGDLTGALNLAMALHRIGRLFKTQGLEESQYMRGLSLESAAWSIERDCLQHPNVTAQQAAWLGKQLDKLPTDRTVGQFLDDFIRYERIEAIIGSFTQAPLWPREMEAFAPRQIDANLFAEWMNRKLDEQREILDSDEPPLVKENRLLSAWDAEFNPVDATTAWAILPRGPATRVAIRHYQARFAPLVGITNRFVTQQHIRQQVLIIACALIEFQRKHGHPPAALSELESVKSRLIDLVPKQPLRYLVQANGDWLLYSTGLNGKDDGGNNDEDVELVRDDIAIRWSLTSGSDSTPADEIAR